MNAILNTLSKYQVALVFYTIYTGSCVHTVFEHKKFRHLFLTQPKSVGTTGEYIIFGDIGLAGFAILLVIINGVFYVESNNQRKLNGWLSALIIAQLFLVFQIS